MRECLRMSPELGSAVRRTVVIVVDVSTQLSPSARADGGGAARASAAVWLPFARASPIIRTAFAVVRRSLLGRLSRCASSRPR
jgi:hypothetical protein